MAEALAILICIESRFIEDDSMDHVALYLKTSFLHLMASGAALVCRLDMRGQKPCVFEGNKEKGLGAEVN